MNIARTTRLFFDASCLFAAAGSPNGGSGFLLRVCRNDYLHAVVTVECLEETERSLHTKAPPHYIAQFREDTHTTKFLIVPGASAEVIAQYARSVVEDAHIVAAALQANVDCLITLDRILIARIAAAQIPLIAMDPRSFLEYELPRHPEYGKIRPDRT